MWFTHVSFTVSDLVQFFSLQHKCTILHWVMEQSWSMAPSKGQSLPQTNKAFTFSPSNFKAAHIQNWHEKTELTSPDNTVNGNIFHILEYHDKGVIAEVFSNLILSRWFKSQLLCKSMDFHLNNLRYLTNRVVDAKTHCFINVRLEMTPHVQVQLQCQICREVLSAWWEFPPAILAYGSITKGCLWSQPLAWSKIHVLSLT